MAFWWLCAGTRISDVWVNIYRQMDSSDVELETWGNLYWLSVFSVGLGWPTQQKRLRVNLGEIKGQISGRFASVDLTIKLTYLMVIFQFSVKWIPCNFWFPENAVPDTLSLVTLALFGATRTRFCIANLPDVTSMKFLQVSHKKIEQPLFTGFVINRTNYTRKPTIIVMFYNNGNFCVNCDQESQ